MALGLGVKPAVLQFPLSGVRIILVRVELLRLHGGQPILKRLVRPLRGIVPRIASRVVRELRRGVLLILNAHVHATLLII